MNQRLADPTPMTLERSFAHLCVMEGLRRVFVRGRKNVRKRLPLHAAVANLGIVMRKILGAGTPRGLQGRLAALLAFFTALVGALRYLLDSWTPFRPSYGPETNFPTSAFPNS